MVSKVIYRYHQRGDGLDIAKSNIINKTITIYLDKLAKNTYSNLDKNSNLEDIIADELNITLIHELMHTEGKIVHPIGFMIQLFNNYLEYGTLSNEKEYRYLKTFIKDNDMIMNFTDEFDKFIKNYFYYLSFIDLTYDVDQDDDQVLISFEDRVRKKLKKYGIEAYNQQQFDNILEKVIKYNR